MSVEVDTREIEALLDRLEAEGKREAACVKAAKGLAGRFLRLVTDATPVKTGRLQNGWTGGVKQDPEAYGRRLPVKQSNDAYSVEVTNNVKYAEYVEYGHRVMRKGVQVGYSKPRYFMKGAEQDLESVAPSAIKNEINKYLREVFDGK